MALDKCLFDYQMVNGQKIAGAIHLERWRHISRHHIMVPASLLPGLHFLGCYGHHRKTVAKVPYYPVLCWIDHRIIRNTNFLSLDL